MMLRMLNTSFIFSFALQWEVLFAPYLNFVYLKEKLMKYVKEVFVERFVGRHLKIVDKIKIYLGSASIIRSGLKLGFHYGLM